MQCLILQPEDQAAMPPLATTTAEEGPVGGAVRNQTPTMDAAAARTEGEREAGSSEKVPFAFSKCTSIERKGSSMYAAECGICGKKVC